MNLRAPKALVSHPREPLSRDKLMNLARGCEYSAMERSIDVQISRCAAWWKRSSASALHSDRLGSGLRLCTGRL
ncbi:hypothetical protein ACLB1O_26420 [Escherichia coli]